MTVNILRVEKNCACASFDFEKYQLAPGESAKLTINVDVAPAYMRKSASCVLKTDHPRFKDWFYTIEFMSLPFVVAEPDVLNLGSFSADGRDLGAVQHATVDVFGDAKIELTRDNFLVPEEIDLNVSQPTEARRLKGGIWDNRYRLSVRLSKKGREVVNHSSRSGITTKTVQLRAGESTAEQWQYSVYWRALPPLESRPSYLAFGNFRAGSRASSGIPKTPTSDRVFPRPGIFDVKLTVPGGVFEPGGRPDACLDRRRDIELPT